MDHDTFTSLAEISLCEARPQNETKIQNSSKSEEDHWIADMDSVPSQENNIHKPVTRITSTKNKVNILEFIGVGNGFDPSQPFQSAFQLMEKQPKNFDNQKDKTREYEHETESKDKLVESDSGLDDDKANELSDDVLFTESESDDVMSSDGEYSGYADICGHGGEFSTYSYDVSVPSDSEGRNYAESPEIAQSVVLLKIIKDIKDSETYCEPKLEEMFDDSESDEDTENCSLNYELNLNDTYSSDVNDSTEEYLNTLSSEYNTEINVVKISNEACDTVENLQKTDNSTDLSSAPKIKVAQNVSFEIQVEIDKSESADKEFITEKYTVKNQTAPSGREPETFLESTDIPITTESHPENEKNPVVEDYKSKNDAKSGLLEVPEIMISSVPSNLVENNSDVTNYDVNEVQGRAENEEELEDESEAVKQKKLDKLKLLEKMRHLENKSSDVNNLSPEQNVRKELEPKEIEQDCVKIRENSQNKIEDTENLDEVKKVEEIYHENTSAEDILTRKSLNGDLSTDEEVPKVADASENATEVVEKENVNEAKQEALKHDSQKIAENLECAEAILITNDLKKDLKLEGPEESTLQAIQTAYAKEVVEKEHVNEEKQKSEEHDSLNIVEDLECAEDILVRISLEKDLKPVEPKQDSLQAVQTIDAAELVDKTRVDKVKQETFQVVKEITDAIEKSQKEVNCFELKELEPEFVEPQSPTSRNVVYQSNEKTFQNKDYQKKDAKEEITLKDYDMSIKDIETERRRIIGNQAVRRKTIQNWINGQELEVEEELTECQKPEQVHCPVQIVAEKCKVPAPILDKSENKNGKIVDLPIVNNAKILDVPGQPSSASVSLDDVIASSATSKSEELTDDTIAVELVNEASRPEVQNNYGEVVSESIIEKKSSTKLYWETLMMSTSGLANLEPETTQDINAPSLSPEPVGEENDEFSDHDICEFPEFDIEEPRHIPEVKEPPRKVPVVIHKKQKAGPIKPICIEVMKCPTMCGNIVEQEIQMQQMREEEFRRETSLRSPVNGKSSPLPSHKPQVVGEVYRSNSSISSCASPIPQTNEFTAEIVLAPPTHYRDSSDSGTFDSESVTSGNLLSEPKTHFESMPQDMEQGFITPDDDKRIFDPEISSDLGDELQCTSPSINHTGSYESLNSVGTSGGSSVDYVPRKNSRVVTVKPLASDDDLQSHTNGGYNFLKETPVEREIRQAKEREEELRQEQRARPSSVNSSDSERILNISSYQRNRTNILKNNPKKDAQKSVATSRIQLEIEEQTNRELELRSSGNIRTISHDRVDSKIPTVYQKNSQVVQIKECKPTVNGTAQTNGKYISANGTVSNVHAQTNGHYTNGHAINNHKKLHGPSLSVGINFQQPLSKRPSLPVMNKGGLSMHKFISSGGKLGGLKGPFGGKISNKTAMKQTVIYEPAAIIKKPSSDLSNDQKPVYRKYCTAESKIQTELRQMKEREEELKRQRTRLLGLSQPNLTLIDKNSDMQEHENKRIDSENERSTSPAPFKSLKERCLSNPNLLDDQTDSAKSKPRTTNTRRRSMLIEQWENKIQSK